MVNVSGHCSMCAIIVTYCPDLLKLEQLLIALFPQVAGIVVVDNGSHDDCLEWLKREGDRWEVLLLSLGRNLGIAAGFNRGISWALEHGFSHVLLLDQDSTPAPDMARRLGDGLLELTSRGVAVGAVGPRYFNSDSGDFASFVRFGILKYRKVRCSRQPYIEVDLLISSGSLISRQVLEDVGMMDEALFIDHVDTEWLLRARSKRYRFFGICGAVMEHSLGRKTCRFWFGRWRNIPVHDSQRIYYTFRNTCLIFKRGYAPIAWKLSEITRLLFISVFYFIAEFPDLSFNKMMLQGLKDARMDIVGKQPLGR